MRKVALPAQSFTSGRRLARGTTPGGRAYDSEAFAAWLEQRRQAGRDVCFVGGGPFGTTLSRHDHARACGPLYSVWPAPYP